jgi:hypothetical protein
MRPTAMKNLLFIVFILVSTYRVIAQTEDKQITYDFTGKLNEGQMSFIKDNYDWNSKDILIINFTQPRSNCHYDNHKHNKNTVKNYMEYYSDVDLKDCEVIFVCPEKHNSDSYLYYDKANFLLNNYFNRKERCFAVMVLNKNGDYLQYNGEYSKKQVSKYIENLKAIL